MSVTSIINSEMLYSERLRLRLLDFEDKHWILRLQQDDLWLKFIGSRGVNSVDDACDYIERTNAQRAEWGYGLWAVEDKVSHQPIGVCGLFNRFAFSCPDLGFAMLPEARGKGLCREACTRVIQWAHEKGYHFLTAMTHPDNSASQRVLERVGFAKHGAYFDKTFSKQTLYWLDLPEAHQIDAP
ncbi:GNAT family N-acetyltransferase [Alteromonas sp. McT4-15]|uniref:GNAT family N-acetyltransferase n=1 Tax=Alteromonas sp. McT4-15 TaxID=2881256 RepID=UPI001CF8C21F|nr:GNAT family N-acetyltransferase [Alteromonas sp. McT4-15]MCB4437777.1 GNAT family N-acetyltransferase [Alteromonas sp. McT4-15]